ncbi:serine hydrolase domain-containing protein [Aquimarina megaterium]|uniref:serine hydrolase domain-containing protein n=1 Tax=Aquimarina megaterium TaxID=1443666 RepID=UPI000472BAE4|nr:serine hydrolase [Aquimarina megaterium]
MKQPLYLFLFFSLCYSCNSNVKKQQENTREKNSIEQLFSEIENGKYPATNAILISQNDSLLFEKYFNGYGKDSLQDVRSTTKSITALLTGIAVDKGILKVDEPIFTYLSQYNKDNLDNWDDRKSLITVEDLLTMRTGIGCEQFFGDMGFPDCEDKMFDQKDWVKYGLDQKMAFSPKEKWLYTGTAPMIMGAVISDASHVNIAEFASDYLFTPLDITNHYRWAKNKMTGRYFTAGNLRISPRNMLTIGHMVINKGKYNGKQVISEKMISEILSEKVELPQNYSFFNTAGNSWEGQDAATYGYYWYTEKVKIDDREITLKFTFGNGGNYIVLVPELDNLVIVFTGSNYGKPIINKQPFDMMYTYVLPHFLK